jgi:hypothetical protein
MRIALFATCLADALFPKRPSRQCNGSSGEATWSPRAPSTDHPTGHFGRAGKGFTLDAIRTTSPACSSR